MIEKRSMDPKVKRIKKEDRSGPAPPVQSVASDDPRDWSAAVKSWVKASQEDRRDTPETFNSVFTKSKP